MLPREHKTRDIAHSGTKREITDDIVTTYSFRTGAESGIYGQALPSPLLFHSGIQWKGS